MTEDGCMNLGISTRGNPMCGSLGGYTNQGCRGEACTAANRDHQNRYQRGERRDGPPENCRFDCECLVYARGACRSHYLAWRRRNFDPDWDGNLKFRRPVEVRLKANGGVIA